MGRPLPFAAVSAWATARKTFIGSICCRDDCLALNTDGLGSDILALGHYGHFYLQAIALGVTPRSF